MIPRLGEPAQALLTRVLVYAAILLIPVVLFVRYQYFPFDDCLRHAAKAVSGRDWAEILLLRDGVTLDQHPGWHALLGRLHVWLGMGKEALVFVEWTLLFSLVSVAVVPFFRRPEAWVGAMLVACLAFPENYIFRLTRGRPYLFTETVLMILLMVWGQSDRRTVKLFVMTTVLLALSTWVHGTAWYLWILPVLAFVLSGRKEDAVIFAGCWLVGSLSGAALTGHPWVYLSEQVELVFLSFGNGSLARMLVGEFQAGSGGLLYLLAVGFVCLVRHAVTGIWLQGRAERLFLTLGVIGWLGGLHVTRFWNEWGLPAFMLWLALMIQDLLVTAGPKTMAGRACAALGLSLGLVLSATGDLDGRWSSTFRPAQFGNCTSVVARGDVPGKNTDAASWLPGDGGIVYNFQMDVFDLFFFEHPAGRWRYVYGYESGLMTAENLQILRNIQFNRRDWAACKPWVDKMKAADRMVILSAMTPVIASLEWYEYRKGLWTGRQKTVEQSRRMRESERGEAEETKERR